MIFERELFLRITPNKPPFIGVCYPEYAFNFAGTDNQDLPTIQKDIILSLSFGNKLANIKIEIEGMLYFRAYTGLKYNPKELKTWLEATKGSDKVNFGHVFYKGSGHEVAKTVSNNKAFVVPLSKVYVFANNENKIVKVIT